MNIPFPKEYQKYLQRGKKDVTIRTQKEIGKYKRNHVYDATDYKGNPFDIEIKILNIAGMTFGKAKKHMTKDDLKRPELKNLQDKDKVEIIKFEPIDKKQKWIEENVQDPYGNCFFYAAVLAAIFPKLTLMKGSHSKQFKEDTNHFWTQDVSGKIYDPTEPQYDLGRYYSFKPINLDINLDFVIKDTLFKTLKSEDQKIIIKRWKNRNEIVY